MIIEAGPIGGVWRKIDFRRLPRPALPREGKSEKTRRTCALIHACCFFERFSQWHLHWRFSRGSTVAQFGGVAGLAVFLAALLLVLFLLFVLMSSRRRDGRVG